MASGVLSYLSTLFGREERSDCDVVFYVAQGAADSSSDDDDDDRAEAEDREEQEEAGRSVHTSSSDSGSGSSSESGSSSSSSSSGSDSDAEAVAGGEASGGGAERGRPVPEASSAPAASGAGPGPGAEAEAERTANGGGRSKRHRSPPSSGRRRRPKPEARAAAAAAAAPTTAADPPAQRRIGEPLPAHSVLLCGGSPVLAAQADAWQGSGPGPGPGPGQGGAGPGPGSAGPGQDGAGPPRPRRLQLEVALSCADEITAAHAVLRFMYTGQLGVGTAVELLRVRRLAAGLQVAGCVEAAERALVSRICATPLAGVAELYAVRHMLPSYDDDDDAGAPQAQHAQHARSRLMAAVRSQLSRQSGGPNTPGLPKLLAWAFPDAPSVLSDPQSRKQLASLSAASLEALLSCPDFATDEEASVLVLLAVWLESNGAATPNSTRQQLFRTIRLVQLDPAFRHGVLPAAYTAPAVPVFHLWHPLPREELGFLQQFAAEAPARRPGLVAAAAGRFDCASPWYSSLPRPLGRSDARRPLTWSIPREALAARLGSREPEAWLDGAFDNGAARVVAKGYEFWPALHILKHAPGPSAASAAAAATPPAVRSVGVYLKCALPSVLPLGPSGPGPGPGPGPGVLAVTAVECRLAVHAWRGDGGGGGGTGAGGGGTGAGGGGGGGEGQAQGAPLEAFSYTFGRKDVMQVGKGLGFQAVLPLKAPPDGGDGGPGSTGGGSGGGTGGGGADAGSTLLAAWEPYLRGGRLTGTLTWL
ncbi:hypothetical protein HYH03_004496 [Edaphochlamys debaryana]|uniref:BACK domain-containing protein n=1 Tax=Edaphochlamys debaryana TaxID=47281 RepID=A0A835Y9P9_9CHLO|nr:hypothetical protein HYH03_004496 [Edaphochlamys debaryana]|eukprot:KAG2497333.1 hypothetical protein HYH03_004496 [Edaphochlamys debaryana]